MKSTNQRIKLFVTTLVASVILFGCHSGTNSAQDGNSPLQTYTNSLKYSTLVDGLIKESAAAPNQYSLVVQESVAVSMIKVSYYQDAYCRRTQNIQTISGKSFLSAGIYTTTDQSNYDLISMGLIPRSLLRLSIIYG